MPLPKHLAAFAIWAVAWPAMACSGTHPAGAADSADSGADGGSAVAGDATDSSAGSAEVADTAPVADAAKADAASADASASVDLGGDATAAAPDDVAGPDVDAAPAPQPYTASGGFTDVSDLLEGPFPVDAGSKSGKPPAASGGLIFDIDGDDTADLVVHDGMATIWLYRSLPKKPWKWFKEKVFQEQFNGLNTVVIHRDPNGPIDIVAAGSHLYFLRYNKNLDAWKDEAQQRGLSPGVNVSLQSLQPADLDQDGLLDLVATVFSCGKSSKLLAFVNQGNGKYAEQAAELGVDHDGTLWNTLHTDVDGDGHPDLLTLSEDCDPKHGNAYLHNRGHPDSGPRYEFKQLPPLFLAPTHGGGSPMGGAAADWNGDGLIDLFLSDIGLRDQRRGGADIGKAGPDQLQAWQVGSNHLLLGSQDGKYQSAGGLAGLTNMLSSTGLSMVAWSAWPADIDRDGHLDLIVSHGYDFGAFILADEGGARPVFFRNQGNGHFEDRSAAVALPDPQIGRALAMADIDNDGDLDLFLGGQSGQPRLLRNDVQTGGHALQVRLAGATSNPFGLGARLVLQTTQRKLIAELAVHSVSHGMGTPVVQFAWPSGEQPQLLTVHWPSGVVQQVAPGQWPIDGAALVVQEPPVIALSERYLVTMNADVAVTVTARRFDAEGKPAPPKGLAIELGPGDAGAFAAPMACDAIQCTRAYKPPVGAKGQAAFVVSQDGKPWLVRPRVRFAPPGS